MTRANTTGKQAVPIYDGVINLDDNQIPVIIGFEDACLRMSSGGREIGEWAEGEYSIDYQGGSVYTITAENEALQFVPNNPSLFAAGLSGGVAPIPQSGAEHSETADLLSETAEEPARRENREIAPPPKLWTLVAFYALVGVTIALGLWAALSIFPG
ncbi:MAG: hypothetical protein ACE1Z0_04515 [Acidimicrobiia bacterium]